MGTGMAIDNTFRKTLDRLLDRRSHTPFSLKGTPARTPRPPASDVASIRQRLQGLTVMRGLLRTALPALPRVPLSDLERRRLGGYIFRAAPEFVLLVYEAVLGRPDRYPDLQDQAERLRLRQQEADLCFEMREILGLLYVRAHDGYLAAQGDATMGARALIGQVDDEYRRSGQRGDRLWARMAGLGVGKSLMAAWQLTLGQERDRGKRARRVAPDLEPKPPNPQQAQARVGEHKRRLAEIYDLFREALHRPMPE